MYSIIKYIITRHVPKYYVGNKKFPSWFNAELRNMIKQKNTAHKIFKVSRCPSDHIKFSHIRAKCKRMTKICYSNFLCTQNQLKRNPPSCWRFIQDRKNKNELPALMELNNNEADNNKTKAKLFGKYFSSVYVPELDQKPDVSYIASGNSNLFKCSFSLAQIFQELGELKNDPVLGPDMVPAIFIKNCHYALTYPISKIFNWSLNVGIFTMVWIVSYVSPIWKSGNRSSIPNYRLVCKLSSLPKLFEKMVEPILTSTLKQNLIEEQHGFMKNKSIETNLILFYQYLVDNVSKGFQVDAIYTDIRKAFDTVDHKLLINKLSSIAISGKIVK